MRDINTALNLMFLRVFCFWWPSDFFLEGKAQLEVVARERNEMRLAYLRTWTYGMVCIDLAHHAMLESIYNSLCCSSLTVWPLHVY